jgi:hypothetical protein
MSDATLVASLLAVFALAFSAQTTPLPDMKALMTEVAKNQKALEWDICGLHPFRPLSSRGRNIGDTWKCLRTAPVR